MKKYMLTLIIALGFMVTTSQAADEGIKVHGHWTFNIYNADGSFDRKVEFENALSSPGTLLNFLNKGTTSIAKWIVTVYEVGAGQGTPTFDHICRSSESCRIEEPGTSVPPGSDNIFPNLTYGLDNTTTPTKFVLSGSFTVSVDAVNETIGAVSTDYKDSLGNESIFTLKTGLSIPVTAGQLIQVTVEISFS